MRGCRLPSASAGWHLGAHWVPVTPRGFPEQPGEMGKGSKGLQGAGVLPSLGVGRVLGHPLRLLHFGIQGTGGLLTSLFHGHICPGDGHSLSCAGLAPAIPPAWHIPCWRVLLAERPSRHGVLFLVTKGAAGVTTKAGERAMGITISLDANVGTSTGGTFVCTEPMSGICQATRWWQEMFWQESWCCC